MDNVASKLGRAVAGGEVNVGKVERLASMFGGGFLAGAGYRRGGVAGAMVGFAGAMLLHRGMTGRCQVYGALGIDSSEKGRARRGGMPAQGEVGGALRLEASITVDRPPEEVYAFWRDFTNAPRFMELITSVEVLDRRLSRWVAAGPRGHTWQWTSELTQDIRDRRLAWHSLPGSDLPNRGTVEFAPGARPGETIVRHTVEFDPPGGIVGEAIARVLHEMPERMIRDDLRRFKALMETGVAATSGRE